MNRDHAQLSRRSFLGWAGLGTGALVLSASGFSPSKAWAKPLFRDDPFILGVASGDPLSDGVVLWTRLAPEPLAADGRGGMPSRKVPVRWEVARDERFRNVVRKGSTFATPELAHSVHVEVGGMRPATEYFYRFKTGSEISQVGRTKTAPPVLSARVGGFSFAFASCQENSSREKFYTPYQNMAEEDLDLVVHLGDYIYDNPIPRDATPPDHVKREPETLDEFRWRHALYRGEQSLQAAHAAFPWLVTWDDHEVAGNWNREYSKEYRDPERFRQIKANAFRAYYEHLPLRRVSLPRGSNLRLYRRVTFGRTVEFNVLDTRQYRDPQTNCSGEELEGGYCPSATDPQRTILGDEQERWLLRGLGRTTARWNVLAQQIIFAQKDGKNDPDKEDYVGGGDQWDGYKADRDTILDFIQGKRPSNPIVITGDIHNNNVYDLKADFSDPDSETLGSEFVGTSISSGGDQPPETTDGDRANDPHHLFFNNNRGYVRCRLDRRQWRTDFRVVPTVRAPEAPARTLATFVVEDGDPGAKRA